MYIFVMMLAVTPVIFSQDDSWKLFDDTEVDEVHITIDSLRLEWIYENVYSDSLHPSTVRYVSEWFDETLDSVGFRLRGNTSRVSEKKSFKLDINCFEQGRSFYGVEKLNLNGEHNDPSIIRSKICWDLYRDLGMVTSRSTHVAVYINDKFYGLYISVEHIDDEFLEKNFSDDSGNLWKCIWPADLTYRGGEPEDYHPYYDDERPYTLKTNKDSYDFSQLARLIGIINQTPDGEFADSLEAVLDVAGVLKYFAMNVLTGGWDDYWFLRNNYYLYHHPSENRFHWIPYDYDNTLGIDWFEIDWTNSDPFNFPVIDGDGRPLAERLMEHDEYRDLYAHFIDFISTNIFELSHWEERMDNLKVNMDPWAETDEYRTYDYGFTIADYHGSFSSDHYENLHVKRGIKEFANLRMGSLPNPLPFTQASPVVYDFSWAPTIPFSDDSIFVSASIFGSAGLQLVEIYFYESPESEPENFPMIFTPVPDTKIVEESDLWTGAIPPFTGSAGYFQIYCEDSNGQSNLFPRDEPVEIIVSGFGGNEFALNEFLSSNDTTNTDESGENDDWLELYNTGTESEDIGGLYLTDNIDNLTKWMIPDGTVIQPQGFLLFWCDEDQDQGELHTNFKLSAGGEFLALVNVDGVTILDSITYGD
ncbi:MAG: CotH kinase family protein, partial [Candidatus Marinimicrobia bacterium]|nr:CotH kinase family protein [Candidatus Neomarinimicrobiota bacterium]